MIRALLTGTVVAIAVGVAVVLGWTDAAELDALSRIFELRGPRAPTAPVVIVTIDEDSFDELNLAWPFPRALHAELLRALTAGHPLVVGFDIFFSEPSTRGDADDAALAAGVAAAGNVVLGAALTEVQTAFGPKQDANFPLPVIRRGAKATAPVNVEVDHDGQLRRAVLRHRLGDQEMLGWDMELVRLAAAAGVPSAPLPRDREIFINFRGGPRTFPWVPYYQVLRGEVSPAAFRDKIVLVGATTAVLQDIFSTPFARARAMPGVEIHANVIETLLRGDPIRPLPTAVSTIFVFVGALGAAALANRLRALRAFIAVGLVIAVLLLGVFVLFAVMNRWLPPVAVTAAIVFGYGATVIDTFVREQRERRRLSQFFSPAVLREIVRHRSDVNLGSSRRLLTVMFSDIRGFTSISERVEPEQVVEMLREYLTEMTEVVFRHGGTVDKYIGDCVMALYNVPFEDADHAANAVRTGLEFQERTLAVSAKWEAKLGVRIRNGVGINTGEAVVGTMGSRQRLEYTAIGDTVNLASRLESLTKEYGVSIIISESTYEMVKGRFLTRELGDVAVKGKTKPVKIYAVLPGDIRQYPRALLDVSATVLAVGAGYVAEVRTRDISEGGVAVAGLPPEWQVGAPVEIRCEGGWLQKPIAVEGRIAWRRDDLAGIAFAGPEPAVAAGAPSAPSGA